MTNVGIHWMYTPGFCHPAPGVFVGTAVEPLYRHQVVAATADRVWTASVDTLDRRWDPPLDQVGGIFC